jgi:hypothetical protein
LDRRDAFFLFDALLDAGYLETIDMSTSAVLLPSFVLPEYLLEHVHVGTVRA